MPSKDDHENELEGIEVETSDLETGGVELTIRMERAIELNVGAGRYTFERLDSLASWLKEVIQTDSEGLDREPGSGELDLETEPGSEGVPEEAESE